MRRTLGFLAVLALIVAAAACGDDDGDDSTIATTQASTVVTTTTAPDATVPVSVYFAWNETIGTAGRTVGSDAPEAAAVAALLEGPDGFETDIGMATEIPAEAELLGLTIADGTATVDFNRAFESGGGSLSMQLRTAQVVFTLTQFDTVETVTIFLDGMPVDAIGGEGISASDLTRRDFENVTPPILVEAPVPGATVSSPLEVSGIANTFERNVRYAVTDPDGLIVAEGFTTGVGETAAWGAFAFTAEFMTMRAGLGAVIVWQDDAATGAQTDVYEVPVRMN